MSNSRYRKSDAGSLIFGILVSVSALVSGVWYLLSYVFEPLTGFFLYASVAGLCFGLAVYKARVQSCSFCREAPSSTSTLKAVGIGVGSGLISLVGSVGLGALYVLVEPPAGEFSFWAFGVRVLAATILSAAVGATFYLPLVGDMGVVFIDHYGTVVYFTGAMGGTAGAFIGAIDSAQAAPWGLRLWVALGVGLGGAALGLLLGSQFRTLFTLLFVWGRHDTVVVPVREAEFRESGILPLIDWRPSQPLPI
jgi:hypothetical protein